MFKRQSNVMKFSAMSALAAFALTSLRATTAHAYRYDTHSRIVEFAVRAMQPPCFGAPASCQPVPVTRPSGADPGLWNDYLQAVRAAPAKLGMLRTGLPTSLARDGWSIIPGGSADTTGFPYHSLSSGQTCSLNQDETKDLNRLNDFLISELDYMPRRQPDPCGLEIFTDNIPRAEVDDVSDTAVMKQRVTELVLGWHGAGVDDHFNDSVIWIRPTATPLGEFLTDAASAVYEVGVGALSIPFLAIWSLFSGHRFHPDAGYSLARQNNPVEVIANAIPGIGDIRSETYTGLWHHEAINGQVHEYNDTRGLYFPDAGPDNKGPGAADMAIEAITKTLGLCLNASASNGPGNYGRFDQKGRGTGDWQAHPIGVTEFSPLHNLAAYGWSRFKSDPSNAVGLGWPLHAIGDAAEPHHVIGSSAWGHVPYELWVDHQRTDYLETAFQTLGPNVIGRKKDPTNGDPSAQQVVDAQLVDSLQRGFRWWLQFKNGQDMKALIHDLAQETYETAKAQNGWMYEDTLSTVEALPGGSDAAMMDFGRYVLTPAHKHDAQAMINNGIGAAIAMLTVAAGEVPVVAPTHQPPHCAPNQVFGFEEHIRQTAGSDGETINESYGIPTCTTKAPPSPANPTPGSQGLAPIGSGSCGGNIDDGQTPCQPNGESCSSWTQCASGICSNGTCGKAGGAICTDPLQCAHDLCSAPNASGQRVCLDPNGASCTLDTDCASGACSPQGICGQPSGAGCNNNAQCASNLCSESGVCVGNNGDACNSSDQCNFGNCVNNVCGLPNQEMCTVPSDCASMECSTNRCGKGFQEPCADSSECSNNNCIDGACGPGP